MADLGYFHVNFSNFFANYSEGGELPLIEIKYIPLEVHQKCPKGALQK